MNFILFLFAEIGVVAAMFGLGHLIFNVVDYFYEFCGALFASAAMRSSAWKTSVDAIRANVAQT